MSLDKALPPAPKGNAIAWLGLFATIAILALVIDTYFGAGNLFGLAKKKTAPAAETAV